MVKLRLLTIVVGWLKSLVLFAQRIRIAYFTDVDILGSAFCSPSELRITPNSILLYVAPVEVCKIDSGDSPKISIFRETVSSTKVQSRKL